MALKKKNGVSTFGTLNDNGSTFIKWHSKFCKGHLYMQNWSYMW